jgi:uncharacterized membrane protein
MDSGNQSSKSYHNDYHKPRTVEDMTQRNVQTIVQLDESAKAKRSHSDHIADAIANFCGIMPFVWALYYGLTNYCASDGGARSRYTSSRMAH